MRPSGTLACLTLTTLATLSSAMAAETNPVTRQSQRTDESVTLQRLIVKLRPTGLSIQSSAKSISAESAMRTLASRTKVSIRQSRAISQDMRVMQWEPATAGEDPQAALDRIRADESVEFAVPDGHRYAHAIPTDNGFPNQWYLQGAQPAAVNAVTAWDTTTGSNGVVIAVLDTGIRFGHTDLRNGTGNRLLPGRDFVSSDPNGSFFTANDGDGWDADPSDPGDWMTADDVPRSPFNGCDTGGSSWHGTRVAGMIGALSNNATGVAGVTWNGWILPVRVLGKCGGFDSDILAAMRWAAGLSVDGAPTNPYPARILNLSLGGGGACDLASQTVVAEITAAGVLVVVSAGNAGGPVASPANCPGAAAIAGIRHVGTKVGFSSLGPQIAVGAPGGNCVNTGGGPCLFSLDTTSNSGTTVPGASVFTNQTSFNVGTSFSAPIVSGIAALMLAVNGNLKAPQLILRLREAATPYPVSTDPTIPVCHVPSSSADIQNTECSCTTAACGAGMANAAKSLVAAQRPVAVVALPGNVSAGQNVVLNGSATTASCNRTIASYAWTTVSGTNPSGISGADTSTAAVIAPAAGSSYTVRLTVTDNMGAQDTANVVMTSSSASSSAPSVAGPGACPTDIAYSAPATPPDSTPAPIPGVPDPPSNGGGGGGALDVLTLLAGLISLGAGIARRRQPVRLNKSRLIRR